MCDVLFLSEVFKGSFFHLWFGNFIMMGLRLGLLRPSQKKDLQLLPRWLELNALGKSSHHKRNPPTLRPKCWEEPIPLREVLEDEMACGRGEAKEH